MDCHRAFHSSLSIWKSKSNFGLVLTITFSKIIGLGDSILILIICHFFNHRSSAFCSDI